ncbi:dephospho-CoA kinase [uncultured Hyphomicrobium sp.]|uniref:dephospho-CoA kinase n=1 Tax=uncultured Hyphomicrobium sp. TaxID=194373 RepID=UPI0025E82FEA|nr:dephospho-CoA kinase [uncultured Hyphomicrobium sp.]
MLIIGLTGSIGMGKSTVAAMFRARGLDVFDADAEVHRLYAAEAVPLIEAAFPGSTADGKVDRPRLAAALASDASRFRKLETIVHPLVRHAEQRFLAEAHRRGVAAVILEIPLLLEGGLDEHVDVVVVVSAPALQQRARVLERPGMTETRLDALLARQLPDTEKRRRADFVVDTGGTLTDTETQVDAILSALKSMPAEAYQRHWR